MFTSLWHYRHFVLSSIRNELISRFARSKLGGLWVVINPLAQVAIYALILSNVLAAKLPGVESTYGYAAYLMAGLLAWTLFSEIISACLNLFIAQGNTMKKMNFPRITLPAIVLGTCALNNLLLFVSIIGIFVLLGLHFSWLILWLIPLTILTILLAMGLGLILGILNVFVRDVGQVTPIILQMLFWFTPIVYPITIIPEEYRHLLSYNPMYAITNSYQQVLVFGQPPNFEALPVVTAISILLLFIGLFMFRKASPEMVDVL
jgi:lipopolysaccharide transport system permease protein